MRFSRLSFVLAAAQLGTGAFAWDFKDIVGDLGGGRQVVVEGAGSSVWTWKRTAKGRIMESREFKDQGCRITEATARSGTTVRRLTCPPGGATPLAGTEYIGRPAYGDCAAGEPEYEYRCVAGCGSGSRAPRVLIQDYYEC